MQQAKQHPAPFYPPPVRRYAGILSAVGIHLADVVQEGQEPAAAQLGEPGGAAAAELEARLDALQARAEEALLAQVGQGGMGGGPLWHAWNAWHAWHACAEAALLEQVDRAGLGGVPCLST